MAHTQLALPYTLIAPDYIPFEHDETLSHYAKRFCEHLLATHVIDPDIPLFIAGYSLGSAVGMELTQYLSVRGVILIGGLVSSDEIRFIPRIFGRYICWWLPLWVYRAADVFVAPAMRRVSGISKLDIALAGVMYHDLARGLFREAYHALAMWHGAIINVPFIRIHGEFDHIIRCPNRAENVVIIPNTKHLVGQAHPELVNAEIEMFIARAMNK